MKLYADDDKIHRMRASYIQIYESIEFRSFSLT